MLICSVFLATLFAGVSGPDFHQDSRISLDDQVLIGTIDKLAVGPNGELLVTDHTAAEVHLFDADGHLIASLDPAACHPGFRMAPIEAFFTSDGIFLVNSGPWGFLFDLNGKCLRSPYDAFRAMPVISWDGQSHLFGYDGEDYILRMNLDGRPLDRIRLRDGARPRFPEIDRRILGGGLVATSRNLYLARVAVYSIHRIDEDGKAHTFGRQPRTYHRVNRDLPGAVSDRLFQAIGRLMDQSTIVSHFTLLDDSLLLIQYKHGSRGRGYQVWTTDGALVTEHHDTVKDHRFFDQTHGGNAYRVVHPRSDVNGALNPMIEVYRFAR